MKKLIALMLALSLTALPLLSLAEDAPVFAAEGATITVAGSAVVTMKADYAQVSVGVSTKAKTVEIASAQNTAAIHAVVEALQAAGVLEEDIVTSSYNVHADYDYSSITGSQKLSGYTVSNQLDVIIRDMEHIGATLDKATAAGANSIYSIQFLSSKADEAKDEAVGYAVQDAIRRAQLLADAAGLELGGIVSISENYNSLYGMARSYDSKVAATAVTNFIMPDDASVSVSVTIVFELK